MLFIVMQSNNINKGNTTKQYIFITEVVSNDIIILNKWTDLDVHSVSWA